MEDEETGVFGRTNYLSADFVATAVKIVKRDFGYGSGCHWDEDGRKD